MSFFEPAVAVVLHHEGGWVSNPADPGGETNWGISTLIIQREGIMPQELGIDPKTFLEPGYLKPMTSEAARSLYRRLFWERFGYDGIEDQTAATKVFDAAVNCGPTRAHIFAQRACVKLGLVTDVDGKLGPHTLAAINSCPPKAFVQAFANEMREYYTALVNARPALAVFQRNWLKRADWGTAAAGA